jgi:hypothetical protein
MDKKTPFQINKKKQEVKTYSKLQDMQARKTPATIEVTGYASVENPERESWARREECRAT